MLPPIFKRVHTTLWSICVPLRVAAVAVLAVLGKHLGVRAPRRAGRGIPPAIPTAVVLLFLSLLLLLLTSNSCTSLHIFWVPARADMHERDPAHHC